MFRAQVMAGCSVEPWCHIEDYFERRMTEMSERNASVVPVKP